MKKEEKPRMETNKWAFEQRWKEFDEDTKMLKAYKWRAWGHTFGLVAILLFLIVFIMVISMPNITESIRNLYDGEKILSDKLCQAKYGEDMIDFHHYSETIVVICESHAFKLIID